MSDSKDDSKGKGSEQAAPEEEPQDQSEDQEEEAGGSMPFMAHLEELRKRMVRASIAAGVGFLIAYAFKEELYNLLAMPLIEVLPEGSKLIYTAPAEAFFTYLKVAILAGVLGASPYIFYQFWAFISPGLYKHERKAIWPFVIVSSFLFLAGAVFCYAVVFPYGFRFFMSFATDDIMPMISLKQYLSFSIWLLLAFGVVFEMPLVLIFLGRIGVVSARSLRKNRKYAILIMFVAAAFFTPPDVISQLFMAAPLLVLYEISIWMVAASEKKRAQREAEMEKEFAGGSEESEGEKESSE